MSAQNRRIVYFMLHVPKCAGSTLIGHMDNHLGARSLEAPLWRNWRRNYIGNRYPFRPGDREVEEVALFHGHALSRSLAAHFPDAEVREAVTLRDPVGFFVSMYNYRAKRAVDGVGREDPPFEVWYAAERKNPITRFLLYRYYGWAPWWLWLTSSRAKLVWLEQRLARFWFVGSYREMNALVNTTAQELGIPGNPERRNESTVKKVSADSLDPALVSQIRSDNAVDAALFDRWSDRSFDVSQRPAAPTELSSRDWVAQIWGEIVSGIAKARIRNARR